MRMLISRNPQMSKLFITDIQQCSCCGTTAWIHSGSTTSRQDSLQSLLVVNRWEYQDVIHESMWEHSALWPLHWCPESALWVEARKTFLSQTLLNLRDGDPDGNQNSYSHSRLLQNSKRTMFLGPRSTCGFYIFIEFAYEYRAIGVKRLQKLTTYCIINMTCWLRWNAA